MRPIGRRVWAIAGGCIPPRTTGREPEFTSRDELSFLNPTDHDARVELTIYHADREPVGPYHVTVRARRLRRVRVNDLIAPEAVPFDTPYAVVVRSDVPIVVQFTRLDSSQAAHAITGAIAYPG